MCNIGRVLHHWDFFSTIHIMTLSWRDRFKTVPPFSCGIGWILHHSDVISRISILSLSWRTTRLEFGPTFRSGWIGDSTGRQRLPVFIWLPLLGITCTCNNEKVYLQYVQYNVRDIATCTHSLIITSPMQGIVGASMKFILFLSRINGLYIKNIHGRMCTIAIRVLVVIQ